jgi:hypothetical protein
MKVEDNESKKDHSSEDAQDSGPRIEIIGSKVRISSLEIDSAELAQFFQGIDQLVNEADSESCIRISVTTEDLQRKLWDIAQKDLKKQVREIHKEGSFGDCIECFLEYYPCPTVRVLDGEPG